jgi:hypothetical protein
MKTKDSIYDFDMMMGHEITMEIKRTRDEKRKLWRQMYSQAHNLSICIFL